MFKYNKESNKEYIDRDELEKTYRYQEKIFNAKLAEQQAKINELIDYLSSGLGENSDRLKTNERTQNLEKHLYTTNLENNLQNSVDVLKQEIENQKIAFNEEIDNLNDIQVKSYNKYYRFLENNENKISNLQETINKEIFEIKQNYKDLLLKVNINIEKNNGLFSELTELNEKIKEKETKHENDNDNEIKAMELNIKKCNDNFLNEVLSIKESFKKENLNLEEKIKLNTDEMATLKKQVEEKKGELNQLYKDNIETLIESVRTNKDSVINLEENLKKINSDFMSKFDELSNTIGDSKIDVTALDDVRNDINLSIENTKQDLIKLQEEINTIKKNNYKPEFNELKKNYNQNIKNVENIVDKLTKSIIEIQEKNETTNKNLQIKIKAYIDSKNTSTINGLNETINKLSLTLIEREKVQKIEMEQLLAEKLKEIQKENERILNKKIEELNNAMRKNLSSYRINNIEVIDNYKGTTKTKKKIFEPIDEGTLLKQTASNNKIIEPPNTGKSQILKFFYDDEDIN